MATFQKFTGINNVSPVRALGDDELSAALNVDIDNDGDVRRRDGFASINPGAHSNLHEAAAGFTLATRGADLVNADSGVVLRAGLGGSRLWFTDLPDGRVAYSNGVATGIASADADALWGVPVPASAGSAADIAGDLHPGDYQWSVTYRRDADGLEGGPAYCAAPIALPSGGIMLSSLPVLAGYSMNVYLTSHYGGERYLAGNTTLSVFTFTGKNTALQRPCPTEFMRPAPAGKLLAFWRGRTLVAVGNVLYASMPDRWEIFHMRRDFKQFSAPITLVQPVADGVYVGTERELVFLAGTQFGQLALVPKIAAPVVLGSGVTVQGRYVALGKGRGDGPAMVCIAGGVLTAGFAGGTVYPMTQDRYTTTATEVRAAFRVVDELPQYLAQVIA